MNHWSEWPPYVPVGARRASAQRTVARLRKQGKRIEPVTIEGRSIAHSFWGKAWCEHLQKFADFAYRLERGRSYVRNGAVCHLEIDNRTVRALVMGSELYEVQVEVGPVSRNRWQELCRACAGSIDSLVELLAGKLSAPVMQAVTDRDRGLFPSPKEIRLQCTCPDMASMCKHVAAALYGIGARLDRRPELLFALRGVDHLELIAGSAGAVTSLANSPAANTRRVADSDLAGVFGIEMAEEAASPPAARRRTGTAGAAPARATTRDARKSAPRPAPRPQREEKEPTAKRKPAKPAVRSAARRREKATAAAPGLDTRRAATAGLDANDVGAGDIIGLRQRLGLTRAELARLLGVSAAAVGIWERADRPLMLQARSRKAVQDATRLTPRAARRRLGST